MKGEDGSSLTIEGRFLNLHHYMGSIYVDEYHRENRNKHITTDDLQSLNDILDGTDFKNGMDVYIDEGDLVFLVHGQGYEIHGEYFLVETKVTVQAFDNSGFEVDMGRFFQDKKKDRNEQER